MMMGKKLVVVVVVVHIIDNKFVCPTIIYTSSRYHTMYVASSTSMVPSAGYPTVPVKNGVLHLRWRTPPIFMLFINDVWNTCST